MDTKKIFILGNGFDLAHHLPTTYTHFMDAMMIIENSEENIELGFDNLFQKYLSGECSERDKEFFQKTKKLYKTDNLKLSSNVVKELMEKLKSNGWFQHFKYHLTDVDTWIDFENEIENVLLSVNTLLSKDFESRTISTENVEFTTEYKNNRHQIGKIYFDNFLDNNLVQFSPQYLNEMRFKSSQIQRVLRNFSIVFKGYGSCEKINDFGQIKFHNFKLYKSNYERTKIKDKTLGLNSTFIEFEVHNLIEKLYLARFSSSYISFNSEEVYKRLLTDLEKFSELFTSYISLIINQLEPVDFFDSFGELRKEIDAVYTFNYSNTFERLYPNSLDEQLNQVEVQYIHGNAQRKNIVFGISDLNEENLKNYKIYGFVKTFQKIVKNTDYMFFEGTGIQTMGIASELAGRRSESYEIIIWGHSLDVSDSEYIQEIFALNDIRMLNKVVIKIWYHSSQHAQLANLMHIMGKDVIQGWMKKGWLVFETAPDIYEENGY